MRRAAERRRLAGLPWRIATMSNGSGCVEVARDGERVAVRDSKDRQGPVLFYTPQEWACFIDGAQKGEFDDLARS